MTIGDDELREIFTGSFGLDQLRTQVHTIEPDPQTGGTRVAGDIIEPAGGEVIGTFDRRVYRAGPDGPLEVFHHGLAIAKPYQGRRFASQFTRHCEKHYRRLRVRAVRLTAGRDAGGRAWATAYDFDETRLSGFGAAEYDGGPSGVGAGGEDVVLPVGEDPDALRRELVRAIIDAAARDGRIEEAERAELRDNVDLLLTPAAILYWAGDLADDLLCNARWPGVRLLEE